MTRRIPLLLQRFVEVTPTGGSPCVPPGGMVLGVPCRRQRERSGVSVCGRGRGLDDGRGGLQTALVPVHLVVLLQVIDAFGRDRQLGVLASLDVALLREVPGRELEVFAGLPGE